jgi:endonuclease/exonuclease/phosphatase family metal-dependent hydrolase
MSRMYRALVVVVTLTSAACLNHALPATRAIETTFPSGASVAPLPLQFKVVTFNVHGQPGEIVAHALETDRALRDADLIVLEEVHGEGTCGAACVVARKLGFHAVYVPEFDDRGGTDGVAIVSRAPIHSAEFFPLPYYNVHINTEHRAVLAATIVVGDHPITVYAVHLTNRLTVAERRRQMMPVLLHAEQQHTPVIIAGDFNTSPFTWIAHLIPILTTTQDDRFEELLRAHGFATPVADSGATSRFIAMKLDGIYTRGFDTRSFATTDALDISDHLALWARLVSH